MTLDLEFSSMLLTDHVHVVSYCYVRRAVPVPPASNSIPKKRKPNRQYQNHGMMAHRSQESKTIKGP